VTHLPAICLTALGLTACNSGTSTAPVPSRVESVVAQPKATVDLDAFCEARPPADQAPRFAWPELSHSTDSPTAPSTTRPSTTGHWTWVNVWATWCAPCIAEMDTILALPDQLAAKGSPITLQLLSVDTNSARFQAYTTAHPALQTSLQMTDGDGASAWVTAMDLDINPVLPLHIFIDPQGRTRCVRSGALAPDALGSIQAVMAAP